MGGRFENKATSDEHTCVAWEVQRGNVATSFSNTPQSLQSSLDFYVTGATYIGKHGLSLVLKGLEAGINDNAESRAIVMHGADYVSEDYVKNVGRLGRNFGCPAVPMNVRDEMIESIKNQTCLFIYDADTHYLKNTKLLETPIAN